MLRRLIVAEIIEEFNRGVPSPRPYTLGTNGISRYGNLKVALLVDFNKASEKDVRKNLWQYKFTLFDFAELSDEQLYNFYKAFARRKNIQM